MNLDPRFDNAEISLEIAPDGRVRFEVRGVPGPACEELEKLLLQALAAPAETREHTPEYHVVQQEGMLTRLRALLGRG